MYFLWCNFNGQEIGDVRVKFFDVFSMNKNPTEHWSAFLNVFFEN